MTDISSPTASESPIIASTKDPEETRSHDAAADSHKRRLVSSLTPEQLARKRENDRAAQRAIRNRTKSQIDALQARIRALESQKPHLEVQLAVREKEAVVAENEDMRRRLESVMELLQPILAKPGSSEPVTAPASFVSVNERSSGSMSPRQQTSYARNAYAYGDASSPTSHSYRPWLPGAPPISNVRAQPLGNPPPGLGYTLPDTQNGGDHSVGPPQNSVFETAPLPLNSEATCPLDSLLLDCLTERRERIAEGMPPELVIGPPYPSFTTLIAPDRGVCSHRLSKFLTDILRTFPDIATLPNQVAVLHTMYLMLRWLIVPNKENYERLPKWMAPIPPQARPHAAWSDHVPWYVGNIMRRPCLRERLIQTPVEFDRFFVPFTTTLSVNWPYEMQDCLLPVMSPSISSPAGSGTSPVSYTHPSSVLAVNPPEDQPDELWRLNPVFETHLYNLANWSVGPSFGDAFPAFADVVTIRGR